MLAYAWMSQVLSSTAHAHWMCQLLLMLVPFMDAGPHPDEWTSALKYCAHAQDVSEAASVIHPGWGQVLSGTVPAHSMCYMLPMFQHLRLMAYIVLENEVLLNTRSIRSRYAVNTQQTWLSGPMGKKLDNVCPLNNHISNEKQAIERVCT